MTCRTFASTLVYFKNFSTLAHYEGSRSCSSRALSAERLVEYFNTFYGSLITIGLLVVMVRSPSCLAIQVPLTLPERYPQCSPTTTTVLVFSLGTKSSQTSKSKKKACWPKLTLVSLSDMVSESLKKPPGLMRTKYSSVRADEETGQTERRFMPVWKETFLVQCTQSDLSLSLSLGLFFRSAAGVLWWERLCSNFVRREQMLSFCLADVTLFSLLISSRDFRLTEREGVEAAHGLAVASRWRKAEALPILRTWPTSLSEYVSVWVWAKASLWRTRPTLFFIALALCSLILVPQEAGTRGHTKAQLLF